MEKVNQLFNSAYGNFVVNNKALNRPSNNASNPVAPPPTSWASGNIEEKKESDVKDKILKYSGLVSLFLMPGAVFLAGKASNKNTTKTIEALRAENEKLMQSFNEAVAAVQKSGAETVQKQTSNDNAVWKALALVGGGAVSANVINKLKSGEELSKEDKKEVQDAMEQKVTDLNNKAWQVDDLNTRVSLVGNSLKDKYTENVGGFRLFNNVQQHQPFNKTKYLAVLKNNKTIAANYVNNVAQPKKAPLQKGDSIWSVSSEFAPIKDGGLGSVPPEIQNNFEKLGVKVPTFVPMYEARGLSKVKCEGDKGTYQYGNTTFDIEKAAEFTMPAYRNGSVQDQKIEVFVSTHKNVDGKEEDINPLVFIRSKDFFGNFIYSPSPKAEENEKFAFFSKAVYELSKGKLDQNSVDNYKIVNDEAYNKFAAPDGMILNDWQAAPVSALMRYKTGCENAAGTLSNDASDKLANMRIVSICHNLKYQGSTLMNNDYAQRTIVSENILNTLFDEFTADIVKNADSGTPDSTDEEREQYHDISNVLIFNRDRGEKNVNFSSMAAHLSDYFVPVSKNYADEVTKDVEQSGSLQYVMQQRDAHGTLTGIVNGNDYKNVALEHVAKRMKNASGIEFETYNAQTPIDEIMDARAKNKINFYKNYIIPFATGELDEKYTKGFDNVGGTIPVELSDEEIINTPILANVGRFVSQKGIKDICDTIKDLYANWDKKYPGKNKPIIYLLGSDGEGGTQRKFIEDLKAGLPEEDARRVVCYHGFAPAQAVMASCDYFLMPSKFEPCGLTQGEALGQATPVIANATGGLVDTIVAEGDEQYGILTEKGDVSQAGFAEAVDKGLDIYFNDKDKYKQMVKNASKFNQSWIQPERKGPIYDYADLFGIDRQSLNEVQI